MSIGNFDSAGLAVVGYAKVNADGSSDPTSSPQGANSGLTITKTGTGSYKVTLPSNLTGSGPNLAQFTDRDLIFVTPRNGTPNSYSVAEVDSYTRTVNFFAGDTAFTILILRTIIPLPLAPIA